MYLVDHMVADIQELVMQEVFNKEVLAEVILNNLLVIINLVVHLLMALMALTMA